MARWFRFDAEAIEHPKIIGLDDRLFRIWVMCLALARLHDGKLGTREQLAKILVTKRRLNRFGPVMIGLSSLVHIGLLDEANGELTPHDWHQYQPTDLSTERVRQFRERNKQTNGTRFGNGSETPRNGPTFTLTVTPPLSPVSTGSGGGKEIRFGDEEWEAWVAYNTTNGYKAAAAQMREAETLGKPFWVPTPLPPSCQRR